MKIAALIVSLVFLFSPFINGDALGAAKKTVKKKQTTSASKSSAASRAAATGAAAAGAALAPAIPAVQPDPEQPPIWPDTPAGNAGRAWASGDYQLARELWEKMAAEGDAHAMNILGVLYDSGQGVEPDPGRAVHWFAQAANAGNPSGMSNYGRMLEQGRGLPANPQEAARWFDQAARQGQPEAQYNLGLLYENGRGVPRDESAAAAWYSRAASQNQREALARLGHFYRIGRGVSQNQERAALLLYAAAMEGSESAINELEQMAKDNPKKSDAILFGQKLSESKRGAMREALKKTGAAARREDDKHICDIYDSAKVVPGSSEMAICYGPDSRLGFLKIDYPAPDSSRADAIYKMVESRFGDPTAGEGGDSRLWNLGSVIVATKYAPAHRQMSLMYMAPRVYHKTKGGNEPPLP